MSTKPLISIVVTVYNSSRTLELCLRSLKNQTYSNVEIVVIDTHSSDNSKSIALNYADQFIEGIGPERSRKRNAGASFAKGKYVLIVDSDMELMPEVIEQCVDRINTNKIIKAIVVPEKSSGYGFWSRCKTLERSFYIGIKWMEAARFFHKSTMLDIGGYDEENTGSEDYDLPHRIENMFGENTISRVNDFITQHEGKISLLELCKKKLYYSRSFVKYSNSEASLFFFKKQSSILLRYSIFFSEPVKLFRSPSLGLGLLYMKTCEFIFAGMGYYYYIISSKLFKK